MHEIISKYVDMFPYQSGTHFLYVECMWAVPLSGFICVVGAFCGIAIANSIGDYLNTLKLLYVHMHVLEDVPWRFIYKIHSQLTWKIDKEGS